jgi:small GTP-binding protein
MSKIIYNFKYIIVGDGFVGKSSIMRRFLFDKFYNFHDMTLGVDFGVYNHKINNDNIKIQIWDTAGQDSFKSIVRSYYRGALCCILVFDVTNKQSFENIKEWKNSVEIYSNIKPIFLLFGNKCDLENMRKVKKEEGELFASENGMEYIETSAKNGKNINESIIKTIKNVYDLINCGNLYMNEKKNIDLKKNIDTDNKVSKTYYCC